MDRTDLIYELKDVEHMTLDELKHEYVFQNWLLRTWKNIWKPVNYRYEQAVERNKKENVPSVGEDYMNGIITEEEYKEKRRMNALHRSLNLNREAEWERRLFYIECQIKEQEAIVYELLDRIEKIQDKQGLPKKSKARIPKPKQTVFYHGYEPRKRTSYTNYNKKIGNTMKMRSLEKKIIKLQYELDILKGEEARASTQRAKDQEGGL